VRTWTTMARAGRAAPPAPPAPPALPPAFAAPMAVLPLWNAQASESFGASVKSLAVRVLVPIALGVTQAQSSVQAPAEGTVVFHAVIDSAGNIIALEPLSGPPQLVPASTEAVRHWKYKPYLPQGRPVEVDTTIEVKFSVGG
jgi:outer membrane biosynthesis protein TonB